MTYERLGLFKRFNNEALKDPVAPLVPTLEKLKSELQKLQDANNNLISMRWVLDLKLANTLIKEDRQLLEAEQLIIDKLIKTSGYEKKIDELIKKIKSLELEHYGYSDTAGHSPPSQNKL